MLAQPKQSFEHFRLCLYWIIVRFPYTCLRVALAQTLFLYLDADPVFDIKTQRISPNVTRDHSLEINWCSAIARRHNVVSIHAYTNATVTTQKPIVEKFKGFRLPFAPSMITTVQRSDFEESQESGRLTKLLISVQYQP